MRKEQEARILQVEEQTAAEEMAARLHREAVKEWAKFRANQRARLELRETTVRLRAVWHEESEAWQELHEAYLEGHWPILKEVRAALAEADSQRKLADPFYPLL